MVSPSGMSFRRSTFRLSPSPAKIRAASSRETSIRSKALPSARISRILASIFSRSSGVKARGKRKSYWNFSLWSWRPASNSASGQSRLTASASTCSALWRMNSPASGLLVVKMRKAPPCAQRQAQVDLAAVELGAHGILGQTGADRRGDRERRGAGGHRAHGAVGEGQIDSFSHGLHQTIQYL